MSFISKILDTFKMESKREIKNTEDSLAETNNIEEDDETNEDEAELLEVYSKIDKAKRLSKIMNVTIDKKEFINSLVELKEILNELIKYEEKYDFDPAPSKDLEYLESIENEQIKLLEKRIAEKKKEAIKVSAPETDKVHFKMESTREMENTADGFMPDAQTDVLYHDRYGEEPCYEDNYREITFNGRNFNIPEVQLCAAILLDGSEDGSRIRESNHYALYFEGRYGIMNIGELHQWLYEKGYLRNASLWEALSLYKVTELKIMLDSIGLKKTGNKAVLIDRIIDNIDSNQKEMILNKCEYVFLSDKGAAFLDENSDYARWHRKSYGVTFEEFNKHRILENRKRQFYDTIFQALNEKAFTYQYRQWFSKLEMIYHNLCEVMYDRGDGEIALRYALLRLYFSTNLASHPGLFDLTLLKYDGMKKRKEYIRKLNSVFFDYELEKISELRKYYGSNTLNIVYSMGGLPYTIFQKADFENAIQDLFSGEFNSAYYTEIIIKGYEKYIRKFL